MEKVLNLDELLKPPPFVRENYSSFLYCPFSRKLNRRVYLYTQFGYALWVRLESDPSVTKFNERVPKIPIAIGSRAINKAPRAISVCKAQKPTVHSFAGDLNEEGASADRPCPWADWAIMRGYLHVEWDSESLIGNPIRFENLRRLLRFVSQAGAIPDTRLQDALIAELKVYRRVTISKLIEQFPLSDPAQVESELAGLIVNGSIYSDIDQNPLSLISEVSAYHAFETN